MCEDSYVQEVLVRERIAEADRRATRHHLFSGTRPPRARNRLWRFVSRLVGAVSDSRTKGRLTGGTAA